MKLLATPASLESEFERLTRDYSHFDWSVAWASVNFGAFDLLKQHRKKIRHVVIGTHFHQTHPDFMAEFANDAGVQFRIDQDSLVGVFHPKVFLFSNDEKSWEAIIGSANFTRAAFTKNVECAVLVSSSDGLSYDELKKIIDDHWKGAKKVDAQTLEAYRIRWQINRVRLKAAAGQASKARKSGIYEHDLLKMSWGDYFTRIQQEPHGWFRDRLRLVQGTQAMFVANESLQDMTPDERKKIAGTEKDGAIKWRLFGSMAGSIVLKNRLKLNDKGLSDALDWIPSRGAVTQDRFHQYVAALRKTFVYPKEFQGLAVATRLLAIKRPDYFLCINDKNKSGLAAALGLHKAALNLDDYWQLVIEPILETPWWNSPAPASGLELQAWQARCAMVDALFYRP